MNALVLLMALLGVSFLGGFIGESRNVRGLGLPSGLEWVALGLLLGPSVLGVIDSGVQLQVEPIALVAIGWLALILGLDFGVIRTRRLRPGRIALGLFVGLGTLSAVTGVAWAAIGTLHGTEMWSSDDRLLVALGLGTVMTETTSHAVDWVAEKYNARGPLLELVADIAEAKDAVPIVAIGAVLCIAPRFAYPWPAPAITLSALVIVAGVVLGLLAAGLLGRDPTREEMWGVLIGAAVLGIGLAARLGLPALTLMFAMGVTLGAVSSHRDDLRLMVDATRRPALLPALVLMGARFDPQLALRVAPLLLVALAARVIASAIFGAGLAIGARSVKSAPLLGLGILSCGELSLGIGLTLAMRFHGELGAILASGAIAAAVLGELVGPVGLRRVLKDAEPDVAAAKGTTS